MLRVNIKGTGAKRTYTFDERVVVADDGSLIGESGQQDGRLLADAGRTLKAADVQALGVAAQLDASVQESKPKPRQAEAKAEAEAEPKPRKRGRPRKKK
jgi:hypothetical protein